MPAEFFAGGQWPFEIDARAWLHFPEGRAPKRFGGEIGGKDFAREFHDGQAAAVHSDAAGDGQGRSKRAGVNAQPAAFRAFLERFDPADVLNDSGEHSALLVEVTF